MDNFVNFLISFAASLVAIVVVLYIERQRRPLLKFCVLPPTVVPAGDKLRPECSWLQIEVTNVPCVPWIAWVYTREPAFSCRAFVSFHCTCGTRLLPGEMQARWSGTVEPRPEVVKVKGGQGVYLRDTFPSVDIHANHKEPIHPVVVFPQPFRAFGWTNESYLHGWRHPQWEIPHDEFVLKLRLTTADRDFVACFRVELSGGYGALRVTQLDPEFNRRYC
ncbi:MAG: hypothetical protein P4L99_24705 [Chthoniobacter sp.]|nr:hypothetical protein [Chthoniobacter sp.]